MNLAELMSPDAPAVITVEEACKVLRVSRGSGYEAARTGEIPTVKLGRRVLVPVPRLLALLGAGEVGD
jgi:excisionase family DNA binding protein